MAKAEATLRDDLVGRDVTPSTRSSSFLKGNHEAIVPCHAIALWMQCMEAAMEIEHEFFLMDLWRGISYKSYLEDTHLDVMDRAIFPYILWLAWIRQGKGISQKSISEHSRISISNIKTHLTHLQEAGYIRFEMGKDSETGRYMTLIEVIRPLV